MIGITPNLKVVNVKETLRFYIDVLGFEIMATVPEYENEKLNFGMAKNGDVLIMFQEKANLEEEYPYLTGDIENKGLTLFIGVNDVDNLYDRVKGKAQIIKEMHTTFYNTKEFAILDNNGFVLTLAQ